MPTRLERGRREGDSERDGLWVDPQSRLSIDGINPPHTVINQHQLVMINLTREKSAKSNIINKFSDLNKCLYAIIPHGIIEINRNF